MPRALDADALKRLLSTLCHSATPQFPGSSSGCRNSCVFPEESPTESERASGMEMERIELTGSDRIGLRSWRFAYQVSAPFSHSIQHVANLSMNKNRERYSSRPLSMFTS